MKIDIDTERCNQPLSLREKIAVWCLLMIFTLVIPARYNHELSKVTDELRTLIGLKD